MSDKPILFSAPMVRALIAGTKTQTRRLHKVGPDGKPRIAVGDRLYVRETWCIFTDDAPDGMGELTYYRADPGNVTPTSDAVMQRNGVKWRPAIHMPRKASRITLTVTDVRVQRLQEISDEDAIDEGVEPTAFGDKDIDGDWWAGAPVARYKQLWNAINGAGSWDANPWVAAYTFTVAMGNIDAQ